VLHINVLELFQGGTTMQDISLQDQDVVEVSALAENAMVLDGAAREFNRSNLNNDEFKVSVIGAVNKPGGYVVHRSDNVLGAIAQAGGLTPQANPGRVFILHATEQGQLTHRELNLQDKKLIGKRPFTEWAALLPNDVVFVDESAARKMAFYGRDMLFDRIAVAAMFPFFSRFFNGQ
jgi:DNA uptake protein ComE-like DNA-binding protein